MQLLDLTWLRNNLWHIQGSMGGPGEKMTTEQAEAFELLAEAATKGKRLGEATSLLRKALEVGFLASEMLHSCLLAIATIDKEPDPTRPSSLSLSTTPRRSGKAPRGTIISTSRSLSTAWLPFWRCRVRWRKQR
jgi:hypothetical protein